MSRIGSFLKLYHSKQTTRVYTWALTEYYKSVYGENNHTLEEHAEQYFTEKRDIEEDVQNFFSVIADKPPKTVRLMLAAVKTFLVENDVELPAKFWRRLIGRTRGSRALTLDKVPSNVEFRRVISHMPIQGKALYLVLSSSGMRIGETLKLKLDDVELNHDPAKISIRGEYTKTGNSRIAFISREAKEAVEEWLKNRSQYLKAAAGRSHKYGKSTVDDRLFPFEGNTAYAIWLNAVQKTGWLKKDRSTNHYTLHPHTLRKFFRTKMGSVIPVDVAEALMGHEGYLTEVYRRYSQEDLAKFYLQGEPALSVFSEAEVGRLRVEVEERNKQLQTLVNGLAAENVELKERIKSLEEKYASVDEKTRELAEGRLRIIEELRKYGLVTEK
jgi:integrase